MADQDTVTVLGPDVTLKGEITFEKALRLHGRLEGQVFTPGQFHIERGASVTGDVEAGNVTVDGEVRGNITAAERIELRQTADYEGDLQASKLTVEEGAIFKGQVTVGPGVVKGTPGQVAGIQTSQPDRPIQRPQGSAGVGQAAGQAPAKGSDDKAEPKQDEKQTAKA